MNGLQISKRISRALSNTPESAALHIAAVTGAKQIVQSLNTTATGLRNVRQSAEDQLGALIGTVNSNLEQIGLLNRQIQIFKAGSQNASALEDQRETLIDEVAAIIPLRQQYISDGTVKLMTREGIVLATTQSRQLEFTARPIITPDMEYAGGTGALSGLSVEGIDITPGGGGAQAVRGGALAGLFEVRDTIAPEVQLQLDALAADLIERFETPGLDATLAPGSPGLFTDAGAVLNTADTLGLSSTIAVNTVVDPDAGGDPVLMRDGLGATAPGPVSDATFATAMLGALTLGRDATTIPGLTGSRSSADMVAALSEYRAVASVSAEAGKCQP